MKIRVGFDWAYPCPQPTPMMLSLNIHHSRASDLARFDHLVTNPAVPVTTYRDHFGYWCSHLVAPPGRFVLTSDALVNDSGLPVVVAPRATQTPVDTLADRPCLTCRAAANAKPIRSPTWPGSALAQARPAGRACRRVAFSCTYTSSSATRTPAVPAPSVRPATRAAVCAASTRTRRSALSPRPGLFHRLGNHRPNPGA